MEPSLIRNFCIIAHIDHGKSTLADRFLEITGTVRPGDMQAQFLDSMDLERERGITIKGKAVTMSHTAPDGVTYQFNLIDTPGHVDFSYEVSRALAACEGALLVVDASQGIEAQTIANTLLAMEYDLELIPVLNKVDLPQAEPERVSAEIQQAFGFRADDILYVSAKEGTGAREILDAVVDRVPAPTGDVYASPRSLVFDSEYNSFKGIIAHVRVKDGSITKSDRIKVMSSGKVAEIVEVGVFAPGPTPTDSLKTGQVGYIATGFKEVRDCTVGDTLTVDRSAAVEPLPGYFPLKSMVFAGLYPSDGEEYNNLRNALEKLQLNDFSLDFIPETSEALGFGFRCGFLGLLHMEIIQERLAREFEMEIITTVPNVEYKVLLTDGTEIEVHNPAQMPPAQKIEHIAEPMLEAQVLVPSEYVGNIMKLAQDRRGTYITTEYIDADRALLRYELPLSEIVLDFYDRLKSVSRGYASFDYDYTEHRPSKLVKLDIMINGDPVDALSAIVHRDNAYTWGRALCAKLKELIPRQMFEVVLQAAIGAKIISRETVRPFRKNVTAKCYGGDVTRKRKLLEKQREGKRRMKQVGSVEIPQEAFLAVLSLDV